MTFLATSERETRQRAQIAYETPGDPEAFKPGLLEGAGTAAATGVGRAGAVANQLAGEAEFQVGALLSRPLDALFDTDFTGFLDEKLRQAPAQLTRDMTPDPVTTGYVGGVLYSVTGIGVPAVVGGYFAGPAGAAYAAGSFAGTDTYYSLVDQGVDPATAAVAGLGQGALGAAAVALPAGIAGRAGLSTLLYGPGVNLAQDYVGRKSTAAWLEQRGYGELAGHYAEMDSASVAADIVLGAAFGYAGSRAGAVRPVTLPERDAALLAQDAQHTEVDTAPGIPADFAALQAHMANLSSATQALLADQPVQAHPTAGEFVAKPPSAFGDDALVAALRESGYPELQAEVAGLERELAARGLVDPGEALPVLAPERPVVARDGNLTGEDAAIEGRLADKIAANPDAAIAEYARLKESEGGKVLNTDVARERPGDAGRPQRQDGSDPGLDRRAAAVVAASPELTIAGHGGDELPAAAVLADADREIAAANQDAPGFEAAVDCFLRGAT